MAEQYQPGQSVGRPEKLPFWQRLMDNHFLLLFLGVVIPTIFYILWGIMEIANLPIAE